MARCDELANCTSEPGRITRLFLDGGMRQAHRKLQQWMQDAGLAWRTDAIGNVIGRRKADHRYGDSAPVLVIGSHIDTVPNGGKYDGVLGILVAIACARMMRDTELPFHVDVIAFSEEEGVRYRLPYLGSHAAAGCFDPQWLKRSDADDISMADAIRAFELNPKAVQDVAYSRSQLLGYMEVHIEQGPVLERRDLPVAIVSAIAGQSRLRLSFHGEAGHAGTTPMMPRSDALVAAAKWIDAVHEYAQSVDGLRATIGQIHNRPNIANVIPQYTQVSLDIRHPVDTVREEAMQHLIDRAHEIVAACNGSCRLDESDAQSAATMDPAMTQMLSAAVADAGVPAFTLPSGAGHDAVAMAAATSVAMLFVRSPGAISHHPDERVNTADVAVAINVVVNYLQRLSLRISSKDSHS